MIFSSSAISPSLVLQPAGGVDDQHIGARHRAPAQRIEDEAGGVGAGRAGDDLGAGALAPDLQLLDGGGAERVAGGEHHLLPSRRRLRGELADRGGLAGAVDADDEDDVRLRAGRRRAGLATGASTRSTSAARTARTSSSPMSLS